MLDQKHHEDHLRTLLLQSYNISVIINLLNYQLQSQERHYRRHHRHSRPPPPLSPLHLTPEQSRREPITVCLSTDSWTETAYMTNHNLVLKHKGEHSLSFTLGALCLIFYPSNHGWRKTLLLSDYLPLNRKTRQHFTVVFSVAILFSKGGQLCQSRCNKDSLNKNVHHSFTPRYSKPPLKKSIEPLTFGVKEKIRRLSTTPFSFRSENIFLGVLLPALCGC